jgi:Geminivirus rep protein central domain
MYERLEYYADSKFKTPVAPFVNKFTDFVRIPQEMRDWTETELNKARDLYLISSLC